MKNRINLMAGCLLQNMINTMHTSKNKLNSYYNMFVGGKYWDSKIILNKHTKK